MKRLPHAWGWYIIGVLMTLFVIVSCLVPARDLPRLPISDKIEHALAYFGLAAWFGGLLRLRDYGWLVLALLALGAGIEVAQGAMGLGRTADIKDFYADAVGVAIGVGLCLLGLRHWAVWMERLWRRR